MRKFKTVALEINYCDRADTDHGIRSVCGQLLCNQVKEVRTLQEIKKSAHDKVAGQSLSKDGEFSGLIAGHSDYVLPALSKVRQ